MSFAYPLGLLGLLSLPVIAALHLLRERRRRYDVSHLGLWAFLQDEPRGPRMRRLPITALLLLDLLAAALFSLALAQPRLEMPLKPGGARHLIVLLDVSTSMRASEGLSTRFGSSRLAAQELLSGLGPRDAFTLITFGRSARVVNDSRNATRPELESDLQALQPGETGHALQEALALGRAAADPARSVEVYLFTDGAFPEPDPTALAGFPYPLKWQLANDQASNQAVVEMNAVALDANRWQVFARFANFSGSDAARPFVLNMGGSTVTSDVIQIPAQSSVARIWQVTARPGDGAVILEMQGGDSLPEDDHAQVGLHAGSTLQAALVAANPEPVRQALAAVPGVDLTVIDPAMYEPGVQPPYEITVFRGALPEQLPPGPVLLVEPLSGQAAREQPALASQPAQFIAPESPVQALRLDPLLEGIDFTGVRWVRAWKAPNLPSEWATLLQAGGVPLLSRSRGAGAPVIALLADLERGNFTRHPAFPILIANVVDSIRQSPLPAALKTGEPASLPSPGRYQRLSIQSPGQPGVTWRGGWPVAWAGATQPGVASFTLEDASGQPVQFSTGVNAGDAVESNLVTRDWARLAAESASAAGNNPGSTGSAADTRLLDLMPYLLAMALVVLFLEARLAWRQ